MYIESQFELLLFTNRLLAMAGRQPCFLLFGHNIRFWNECLRPSLKLNNQAKYKAAAAAAKPQLINSLLMQTLLPTVKSSDYLLDKWSPF